MALPPPVDPAFVNALMRLTINQPSAAYITDTQGLPTANALTRYPAKTAIAQLCKSTQHPSQASF